MTRSHRSLRAFRAALACVALFGALPASLAAADEADPRVEAGLLRDAIDVVSTNVQGKNVYIPSTLVVEAGKPATLSAYNTTDKPHGFSIDGAGVEAILEPGVEQKIEVPALEPGIYNVFCHLHPAHRNGRLLAVGD